MPVTALIAGGIGAAGSIGGSLITANAAKDASNNQVALGQQALQTQKDLFNTGLTKQAGYVQTAENTLNPFINAGSSVLSTLKALLTPGADQSNVLAQTPGFQFSSQYGTKAATNALASRGLGASAGPLATAVSQFNNGLASTTWGNIVNALQGYAGMGANAGNTLANIEGNAGNADLTGAINTGNSQAGTLTNIGNAGAAGTLGTANALAGGITGATGGISNALILGSLAGGGPLGASNGLYTGSTIPGAVGPTSVNGGPLLSP